MLQEFTDIIGYSDFRTYFQRFALFVENSYSEIVNYYSGGSGLLNKEVVKELNSLIKEYDLIVSLIEGNKNRISISMVYWEIVETLDDIGIKLQTIKRTPKWMRSSFDIDYTSSQVVDGFLQSRQTVENLALQLGSNDQDQDWSSIAVGNNLYEEDYTYEGDKPLKIRVQFFAGTTPSNSVDIMIGDNILGKDLYREIVFEEDDVKSLIPSDTLLQTVETILSVVRGSIPEFPFLGVDQEQIGTNIKALQFPSIFRQLSEMFKQDDSFEEVELLDTFFDQDAFVMNFSIKARTGLSTESAFRIFDDTYDSTFN